jgi:hypothetical protein
VVCNRLHISTYIYGTALSPHLWGSLVPAKDVEKHSTIRSYSFSL